MRPVRPQTTLKRENSLTSKTWWILWLSRRKYNYSIYIYICLCMYPSIYRLIYIYIYIYYLYGHIYIYVYCIYIYIYMAYGFIVHIYIYTHGFMWIYMDLCGKTQQTCHWSDLARPRLWRVDARDLADLQLPPATQQLQRQQLQLQLDFKPAVTLLEPTNSVPKTNKTVLEKPCWSWFSWV